MLCILFSCYILGQCFFMEFLKACEHHLLQDFEERTICIDSFCYRLLVHWTMSYLRQRSIRPANQHAPRKSYHYRPKICNQHPYQSISRTWGYTLKRTVKAFSIQKRYHLSVHAPHHISPTPSSIILIQKHILIHQPRFQSTGKCPKYSAID